MFEQYNLVNDAKLVLNYIDGMTDRSNDHLPYWLTVPHKKPAEAEHCRVDDAELVGSWFEAVDSLIGILGNSELTDELYEGFRGQLLRYWGARGLRYNFKYSWTHSVYSSFHEMGYILPALNRLVKNDPNDAEAEKRAAGLVEGLRSLVIERKYRRFWSGDTNEKQNVYEFPNDLLMENGEFDLSRHTGRGEQSIRNGVVLHALVDRYVIAKDETALDLAIGIANHLLGVSRYFNYKYEFFGHVHSAAWIAAGLIYLGRVIGKERYIDAGEGIYGYVRSLSSDYGWVPEYAQWHRPEDERCETCCIKDMILCQHELILCGKTEYWKDFNIYARNQLTENQIKYTGYVTVDNSLPDADGKTYHDLDKRLLGGYTGGSEPNSISLTRFRSIAGCCVGTAPIALGIIWENTVTDENGAWVVNVHTEKQTENWSLTHNMPDEGRVTLTLKKAGKAGFRIYDWMGDRWTLVLNGVEQKPLFSPDGHYAYIENLDAGDVLELAFPIETVEKTEFFAGKQYTEFWRGGDVVDVLPRGEHVRLYQRDLSKPKYLPLPEDVEYTGVYDKGPTQQTHKK